MRRQTIRFDDEYISKCISTIKRLEGIKAASFEDILDLRNLQIVLNYLSEGRLKTELDELFTLNKHYDDKEVFSRFGFFIIKNYSHFGFPQEMIARDTEIELCPLITIQEDSSIKTLHDCLSQTYTSLLRYSQMKLLLEDIVFDSILPFGPLTSVDLNWPNHHQCRYSSKTANTDEMHSVNSSKSSDSGSLSDCDQDGDITIECSENIGKVEQNPPEEICNFLRNIASLHFKQNFKIIYNKTPEEDPKPKAAIPVISKVVHSTIKDDTPEALLKKQENLPTPIKNFHAMLIDFIKKQENDELRIEFRKKVRAEYSDAKRRYFQYLKRKGKHH